ncbi:DMT family transporter [Pectinatus haikarae]|uniref:Spermidine export protein MdtJ n=1 Tax=Pectinatus haikarae TaxID=349096 RepID=A0ABT9Y9L8_9FIRM|nr:multidrug efflux SMR transporter [Pectinatus haikarae]MDQ0204535.1 spermidine export protein MdtJ [Pectinatus haikarae]
MKQWYALIFAVIAEVSGTTIMKKFGNDESIMMYCIIFSFIGISYFLLAKAVTRIPMSTAYAFWEGVGLAAITFIGWSVFEEKLPIAKIVGFSAIFIGIILLNFGTVCGEKHE